MRELKFRAWGVRKNEFIYINLNFIKSGDLIAGTNINWQQFTGSKDKNGKEIFEGDVVKTPLCGSPLKYWKTEGNLCAEIYWSETDLSWGIRDTQRKERYDHYYDLSELIKIEGGVEVIGNIHENPELNQ